MDERADAAVERLYRVVADRLWRSLLAYSGNPDVASDAMAEAFAQLLRRGTDVREPERWIWRAAFRIAAGELKRASREPPRAAEVGGGDAQVVEVLDALRRVSPKQRAAVVLHHHAGYSVKEVAELIDSTPLAVRVHLSQGRRRLRRALGGGDG